MVTANPSSISELWYSLLHLDLRAAHARDALTDTQAMHKLIQHGFPTQRAAHNILYQQQPLRSGYAPQILVQSTTRPGWGTLNSTLLTIDAKNITKQWQSLKTGTSYRFRITANPTTRDNTRRRRAITEPPAQTLWLIQRLTNAATIRQLHITNPTNHTGNRENTTVTHYTVTYSGILTITNAEHLRQLIATGIGPAKAYGCGLLTLAP